MDLQEMLHNVIRVLTSQQHLSQIFNTEKTTDGRNQPMASSTSLHKYMETSPSKDKST